jgi:formate hydrogenlyase transcriptional activator
MPPGGRVTKYRDSRHLVSYRAAAMSPGSDPLLETLEPSLAAMTSCLLATCDGVLARVWLIGRGDQCATCAWQQECPDRTTCLHLVASAGLTSRLDGSFRRFPIGGRLVGQVVATGQPLVARDDAGALGVADPAWIALHRVQGFAAIPIVHAGQCLGVAAVFARAPLDDGALDRLGSAVRLGASALGHARAFRELARERNRLAARNAELAAATGSGRTFADIQRAAIERTLVSTRGRISGPRGAALALGMRPTTLESKMKKLGVRRPARRSD